MTEVAPAPAGSCEAPLGGGPSGPVRDSGERWSRWLIWLGAAALAIVAARNVREAWQHHDRLRALRCDRPVHEFGRTFQGRVVEQTFHVVNVSRRPVTIDRITTSCGCTTTAIDLAGTTIAPQAGFDLPVRLDLTSKAGEVEQPVVVRFAGEPPLELTLKLRARSSRSGHGRRNWWCSGRRERTTSFPRRWS